MKITRYVARVGKDKVDYHEVEPDGNKGIGAEKKGVRGRKGSVPFNISLCYIK